MGDPAVPGRRRVLRPGLQAAPRGPPALMEDLVRTILLKRVYELTGIQVV